MSSIVRFDPLQFREHFDRRPFMVEHDLCAHPLFGLPRLVRLARELPADRLEYNTGDVPVDLDPSATPGNGLSAEETVRRIEECNSWMVLKNVESDPEYAALMLECLEAFTSHSEVLRPGTHLAEAFVFVSSPGSVTPFHIDPEHNFLLQVRGEKTIFVFDPADREIVSDVDLERFFSGAHRNLRFDERWQGRASECRLAPGRGVHVPVAAPHWVKNGDGVSISFSVTFRSARSKRIANIHQMNQRLRRCGMRPCPLGASALRDRFKHGANWVIRGASRLFRRVNGAPTGL